MVKPILVIGNKNYSSWSLRGWLVLKHLNIEFEEKRVRLFAAGYKSELLEYSGSGLVPVYLEAGRAIWDSLAICEYLAESHPHLWPVERADRAVARCISAEMHAGFTALRGAMPMNCRAVGRTVKITDAVREDVARIDQIWSDRRRHCGTNGPWLFGEFTIADVMFAPVASRFHTYGISLSDAAEDYKKTVLADANIRQWYADAAQEADVIEHAEVGR